MATSGAVITRISEAAGVAPATVDRMLRPLRAAGLAPKGRPGRGQTEGTYLPFHIMCLTLGFAGAQPSDAAEAAEMLRRFEEALDDCRRLYRKSLWTDADCYCEIWLEKDALAGVILPVTDEYDVPLMVARGYASLSFLYEAAEYIAELDVPTYIYHLGDYDPSGVNAGESIERTLRELAPDAEIHFKRLAVTPGQITRWNLPTRPTKAKDPRSKKFGSDISVELDAIDPITLRAIVRHAIEQHLPADQLAVLQVAKESERELLTALIGSAKQLMAGDA